MIDVRFGLTAQVQDLKRWFHDLDAIRGEHSKRDFPLLVEHGSTITVDGAMYIYGAAIQCATSSRQHGVCYLLGVPIVHVHAWETGELDAPSFLVTCALAKIARTRLLYQKVAGAVPLTSENIMAFLEDFGDEHAIAQAQALIIGQRADKRHDIAIVPARINALECIAFGEADPLILIGFQRP
jgi:hypothetical protein